MKNLHADDATLLRYITDNLTEVQARSTGGHLSKCAGCRGNLGFIRRLDFTLRSRPELLEGLSPREGLAPGDPFAIRPRSSLILAREAGLDGTKLAAEAAAATISARGKCEGLKRLALQGGGEAAGVLAALRLEPLVDRLSLSYLLEEARELTYELPAGGRDLAGNVLELLSSKRTDLRRVENKAAEHILPLGDLLGLAHLLAGVGQMRRGDYEAARGCFAEAYRALGEGRGAAHRFAAVELYESECRSFLGDPPSGLRLAERCRRTFVAYRMKRDEARALSARAIALYYLGRLNESLRTLRKALAAFEKLKMWAEYRSAVGDAGFCLAALGKRSDVARLYRERNPSSKKGENGSAVYVLRVTTSRRPFAGVIPLPEHLFAAANEPAAAIVAAAKTSVEKAEKVIRSLDGDPRRAFVLLDAAQRGCLAVPAEPVRMVELSELLFEEASSLLDAKQDARTPTSTELVQAECALLESYAHLQLGHNKNAGEAAEEARSLFGEGGDVGLGKAFCDFYGGQAAFLGRDFATGERLLKKALKTFAEFGQEHLVARVEGALGTLLAARGDYRRAIGHYDHVLAVIDRESDPQSLTKAFFSKATALSRLGRFDEARAGFARALGLAGKYDLGSELHMIRGGLAELDFLRGHYQRAISSFGILAGEAKQAGFDVDLLISRLYIAECLGRLGFAERMVGEIASLRADQKPHAFAASPAMDELFSCLDQDALDADLVGHVRRYLEDAENGIQRPYQRLRLVG